MSHYMKQLIIKKGDYLCGLTWITWAFHSSVFCIWWQKRKSERVDAWEGTKAKGVIYCWLWRSKGSHGKRQRVAPKTWEEPKAQSQQGSRDLSLTATRKWILSTTRMSLEENTSPEPPDENWTQPTLWFQSSDACRGEPTHMVPDSGFQNGRWEIGAALSHFLYGNLLCSNKREYTQVTNTRFFGVKPIWYKSKHLCSSSIFLDF